MDFPKQSPLKQIRKFCLDCVCDQRKMIRFCCATNCPLWYLRFGKFPKTFIREKGEIVAQLFDPENFKVGAKFDPHTEVEKYKLEP
jgi:hypothetical protein